MQADAKASGEVVSRRLQSGCEWFNVQQLFSALPNLLKEKPEWNSIKTSTHVA
jgi:hypothetical protein